MLLNPHRVYEHYLHIAHCTIAKPIAFVVGVMAIARRAVRPIHHSGDFCIRTRSTAWMPHSTALQIHLLTITKWIAAFGAACACWMKMMIIASLQHFAADETIAIRALHAEQFLVTFLAIRHTVFAHILAIQHGLAVFAAEARNVPLTVQRNQCLALFQLFMATGAAIRIIRIGIEILIAYIAAAILGVLVSGGTRWTAGHLTHGRRTLLGSRQRFGNRTAGDT